MVFFSAHMSLCIMGIVVLTLLLDAAFSRRYKILKLRYPEVREALESVGVSEGRRLLNTVTAGKDFIRRKETAVSAHIKCGLVV